jgi:hypothetical protein
MDDGVRATEDQPTEVRLLQAFLQHTGIFYLLSTSGMTYNKKEIVRRENEQGVIVNDDKTDCFDQSSHEIHECSHPEACTSPV